MATGFIDGALITSALTTLNLGRRSSYPEWHLNSLLESTYLLLYDNIRIIPRPQGPGGELGDYAIAAAILPQLFIDSAKRRQVFRYVVETANTNVEELKRGWESVQIDEAFLSWADLMRRDRWTNQVLTYGGLFDEQFVPVISSVIGSSISEVRRVQELSRMPKTVTRWARQVDTADDARIANMGWVIGGFLRGYYYTILAGSEDLQLLTHPFRQALESPQGIIEHHEVTTSQQVLVKLLVADALSRPKKSQRIRAWAESIQKCRNILTTEHLQLPNVDMPRAEQYAIAVAKRIPLEGAPRYWRWALDGSLTAILWNFGVAPWISFPLLTAYRLGFDKTPGEHIGDALLRSDHQLRYLARSIPGKIQRTLK